MWAAILAFAAKFLGLLFSKPTDSEVFRQAGADAQDARAAQEAAKDAEDANRIRDAVAGEPDSSVRNDKSGFWRD